MKVCPRYEKVIERSCDVDEHLQIQGFGFMVQGFSGSGSEDQGLA